MNPKRWQKINDLFLGALERESTERAAFIEKASDGDDELRREVESLLASHEAASQFIEEPLVAEGARLLAGDHTQSMVGRQIGHYRIISLLGAGGMGEVYLAEDSRLGRKVAIKILPIQFSEDRDRVRRLQQEARAASGLNHPNILTIHEIGEFEGRHFIATEFIDGETLRTRLTREQMNVNEAFDIALQITSALVKAHAAGIAHRDIKPDNIMVNRDGYIKVLDFGLAKLTERQLTPDTEAPTRAMVNTEPGMVMGTANYMSPEQARGLPVDTRSDIWSLGVVLYQMIAGRLPFEGTTPTDVIAKVLEREPPSLTEYIPELPDELERVVQKALTKERNQRYQTAKDLLIDLKSLRQQFESGNLKYGGASRISGSGKVTGAHHPTAGSPASTEETPSALPTSSAQFIVSEIKRHKTGVALAMALLIVALAGVGFGLFKLMIKNRTSTKRNSSFGNMKITRLNARGHVTQSAISRDGKYVAYAMKEKGKESLWVRQVSTGSEMQVVPATDFPYWGLTFTNDGDYVYYVVAGQPSLDVGVLYRVPTLGGNPRKLLEGSDTSVTFSPDGKKLAFVASYPSQGSTLFIANSDGTAQQVLAKHNNSDETFQTPSWSPDGKVIACATSRRDATHRYYFLVEVRVSDGVERPITPQTELWMDHAAWLADGTGLVVTGALLQARGIGKGVNDQIWLVSYPNGETTRITNDLSHYIGLSLTSDSGALVAMQDDYVSNLWIAPRGDSSKARRITSSKLDGMNQISWTPDNNIIYQSRSGGTWDLAMVDADGRNRKQLTFKTGNNAGPVVTSDGRYVVFISDRAGNLNVWRMTLDGNETKQLTNDRGDSWVDCTPDGKWVLYSSRAGSLDNSPNLWKVSIDGGSVAQLTNNPESYFSSVSPDGNLVAFLTWIKEDMQHHLAVMSIEGGPPIKIFGPPWVNVRWSPDGQSLQYITWPLADEGATSSIWSQPLNGGPPKQIVDVSPDALFSFAWSRDGKQLAYARGSITRDVVLITDFK